MAIYKIYIHNLDKFIEGKSGRLLKDIIIENGLPLEMPCGGNGICGGCALNIRPLGNKYGFKTIFPCSHLLEKDIEIEYLKVPDEELKSVDKDVDGDSDSSDEISVAVDIGTTGVTIDFLDLEIEDPLAVRSFLNPQVQYGNDLISRIDYIGGSQEKLDKVKNVLLDKLTEVIDDLGKGKVKEAVFAANTTMLHIIAGENPYGIAVYPYQPVFLESRKYKPGEFHGWDFDVTLLPSASAYIGSDIISGIFATEFYKRKDSSLFIDIGTNGEIVMNINGEMKAVSASAGPAFEGMNIECGSRAVTGAVESIKIKDNGEFKVSTIGDTEPKTICGSGLIDIASELLKAGIVEESGRFTKDSDNPLFDKMKDKKFYITDKVYLSQKDIRQIQLAKAAISAGIKILLEAFKKDINDLDEVIVAGSFGYHLNKESVLVTGIIPKEFKGKISSVGNSSLLGAVKTCYEPEYVDIMDEIAKDIDVIELSLRDDFQDVFVKEMKF